MTKPKLRKNADISSPQSPHDGIHTCSKGCKKPGCTRTLRETIEENARLKAEVERLTALNEKIMATADVIDANNQRLTKAGDALGSALILFELKSEEERQEYLKNWAIAKYGKLHD
jgi:SMC interacting uncharacterized protein involved in chromosome segregation